MAIKKEKALLSTMIGATINAVRNERNYSLKELAEKAGISDAHLNQIEGNVKKPSVEVFDNLCLALDTPSYVLLLKAKIDDELQTNPLDAPVFVRDLKPILEKVIRSFKKRVATVNEARSVSMNV